MEIVEPPAKVVSARKYLLTRSPRRPTPFESCANQERSELNAGLPIRVDLVMERNITLQQK